jgi:DNA polymerase III subunit epsilon
MEINLTKPLAFFDLETTGLMIGSDRIVEICILKANVDQTTETKTWRVNPEMPIPAITSAIHGIYDKDVVDCKTFKELAPEINHFLKDCDLAGFNSNKFDIPVLMEEFLRVDIDFDLNKRKFVDVQNIYHLMEPRNLSAAYKFYCNKDLINAHSAEADVIATYEVFKSQLDKYKDTEIKDKEGKIIKPIQNNIEALQKLSTKNRNADFAGRIVYNEKGVEVFNFGKHKDKSLVEVFEKEPSYYNWMMQGDFPLYTKKIITQIRLRMKTK